MECSTKLKPGTRNLSRLIAGIAVLAAFCVVPVVSAEPQKAASTVGLQSQPDVGDASSSSGFDPVREWITPERVSGTCSTVLLISALSLAPALILMTTSFVRISIVFALIRQALGTAAVPSNQVMTALALFMSAAIMAPVVREIHQTAIVPYQADEATWEETLERAKAPLHRFMARQIERTGNAEDVWLFLDYSGADSANVASYDQVPFQVLAPAFVLSELKTAFLIGFQIYLPFLVIDLVVSAVAAGIGLSMVSPTVVALPAKLLLFVMVDGWHLIVRTLLESFST
jgi:flagellar biosynthetic protein FliP